MDENRIAEYAGAVFGYCVRRLSSLEDAKDLSQEIMLELIRSARGREIKAPDAWVWKVARNRLARFVGGRRFVCMSLDDSGVLDTLADDSPDGSSSDESSDALDAAFGAIHSLAESHREILVDRYVHGLSVRQIAEKRGLPEGTVKTRLFYGREKLKESWRHKMKNEKIYEKLNWFCCGNGNIDTSYIERQISRAIVSACYTRPLTVEELSLATGVPCLYIEDELPGLLHGEIVAESGGRYVSNIIVHSEGLTKSIEALLLDRTEEITKLASDALAEYDARVRALGFHGNDFPAPRLWWSFVPLLLREACEEARRLNGRVVRGDFPPRRDGGKGWIFANVAVDGGHRYFSGCNGHFRDDCKFFYYWTSRYFDGGLNDFLRRLEDEKGLNPDIAACGFDDYLKGELIKHGLAEKRGESVVWSIPVFTEAQHAGLAALLREAAKPAAKALLPAVDALLTLMKAELPRRLHDQIRGVFGAELNSVIAMVCDHLEENGLLESPSEGRFTRQVVMVAKSGR